MARLYIVDGVSSVWKQDLVHYVDHLIPDGAVVRKFSTRNVRIGENANLLDLEFVDRASFEQINPDYTYEYAGERYGIQRSRLETALRERRHVFVIVRNAHVIRALRADFARHGPVAVFVHMDVQLAANRSAARNPELRRAVRQAFDDYLREPNCYDEVLVNGGSQNDFFRLLGHLVKRGVGTVLVLREAGEERPWFLVASTQRARRVAQAVLAVITTVSAGLAINIVSQGMDSYWQAMSFILDISLLSLSVILQVLLVSCWRERS